jgi:dipeptidyl aminopeptidase/acylaminoacyl peptidase
VTVVSQLSVPLLILHGMADTDVPVEQSQEYELVARALGKSVSAVYFDEVGHGTTFDPKSASEARRRAIAFFRETL